jgi:RND superfamily putative drug exporter
VSAVDGGLTHRAMTRVGRFCTGRPWWVLGAWVVLAATVVVLVAGFGRPTEEDATIPGSDAQRGRDLLAEHFPGSGDATGSVIVRSPGARVDDPRYADALTTAAHRVGRVPHVVAVTGPDPAAGSLSADGRTGYLTVQFDVGPRDVTRELTGDVLDAAEPLRDAGLEVLPGGSLARPESGTRAGEAIGLGVALVVLVVAFGGLVAASLPLLTAMVTLVCGVGAVGLAGHLTAVPSVATTLATMIGLGVGIDYALFLITRYRALPAGDVPAAVTAAVASSGSAVVFAGGTVVVALAGLAVAGVPILVTLAWTAALTVGVAVAAAVTLLPALLTVLGPRLHALPVRRRPAPSRPSRWGRLADRVTRRPWRWALVTGVLLALSAVPAAGMTLGQTDAGDDPPGTASRAGFDALAEAFGPGVNAPLTVVAAVDTPVRGPGDPVPAALTAALREVPGVHRVQPARVSADGAAVSVRVTPETGPGDPATARTVTALGAVPVPGARVYVTGPVALRDALAVRVAGRTPYVVGLVVLLAATLVFAAFRAPVVAAKAAVMNLLSVASAYGVLTAVFSWGWGVGLTGLDGPVPIEAYVPLMLFALLFGLSMDYEVFLLTAVLQAWRATGDNRRSVREGLVGTGAVITSAALIMVCVFAGFVLSPNPVIKMMGVGMAVAVAVDATVVRGVLVPATMALLGRANWWTPRWPRRAVRVGTDGPVGTGPGGAS